jgi:dephospho-CoA kinase
MFFGMKPKKEKKVEYSFKESIPLLNQTQRMHGLNCPIIGLTGGIATGKSTVARIFIEKGFNLISADLLVKKIYQRKEVIEFIKENWPDVFEGESINFKLLRNVAFSNIENRTKIEELIYSHLKEQFLEEYNEFTDPRLVIYDVPLLYEKRLNELIDYNIVVYSEEETQIERLMKRDHVSKDEALLALSNQMNIEKKKSLCDYLIVNSTTIDALTTEVELFITKVLTDKK